MKKFITLIAAAAMLAVSCNKENAINGGSTPGVLTATFEQTKVSYTEVGNNLQPAWEVDDEIIGFDAAGATYTFTVTEVKSTTATLSADKAIADGEYHLIFKAGAQADDIQSKSLAVSYADQSGNKTMPAVMLADGTVTDGGCEFTFSNAGAIVGISAVKGVPASSTISKITVEGENLSGATVALDGSVLKLTATTKTSDAISTAALSGITAIDANGTLSSIVYVAVPAGAVIKKVCASVAARTPETMKIPSTADDYVEIAAKYDGTNVTTKKWAKWNVGANSQSDYGWYFAWAGTEGYVYKNSKWVTASGVDSYSYTLSSAKTTVASDYLYVKTQSFTPATHSFEWAHTPFNNGSSTYDATYFSSVKSTVCPDDVLAKEYDAARVNWGGTWRMPTFAEFQAMKDATYWKLEDGGYYVYAPNPATDAGNINESGTGTYSKESALLFFPAAGFVGNASLNDAGSYGYYWSSSLYSSDPKYAYYLYFSSDSVSPQSSGGRCLGLSVRPVSD